MSQILARVGALVGDPERLDVAEGWGRRRGTVVAAGASRLVGTFLPPQDKLAYVGASLELDRLAAHAAPVLAVAARCAWMLEGSPRPLRLPPAVLEDVRAAAAVFEEALALAEWAGTGPRRRVLAGLLPGWAGSSAQLQAAVRAVLDPAGHRPDPQGPGGAGGR